ncbi:MAG: calcium/sodium antiporter [Synechococcales cyanobacterium K44_A2020_017]|nr:calcium/sodium antiporter [Synechococcales cyanobacterium K32_A2020_035]MBF2096701.1 calcium/sodium antiporter [Synechococcales cyanobacterium K44_A2020_017]
MDSTVILLFIVGCALLIAGAEMLVNHASFLALAFGISPLVIGLTIVAYGTSAPELVVSVQSSYSGQGDLAVGNLVGSNIANVLLILGVSSVVTPLVVSRKIIRLEVPLLIGISIATMAMAWNGSIGRLEGSILFLGALLYTGFIIYQSRREESEDARIAALDLDVPPAIALERPRTGQIVIRLVWIIVSFAMLVVGSRSLVYSASAIARSLGFSELIIGLTIVAVGTSLPELATSVMASIKGEKDIAIGNVIGSNIFNILFVMGVCSMIAPEGLPIALPALRFDIPVMVAVAIACLPIFFTGGIVDRWEGLLFLGYYLAYTSYLVFNATQHDSIELFSTLVLALVALLTLVALMDWIMRMLRASKLAQRRQRRKELDDLD